MIGDVRRNILKFIIAAMVAMQSGVSAHAASMLSVREAFLEIPERDIVYSQDERKSFLITAKVDDQHAYLRYRATDNSENFEFALFLRNDGKPLAAMSWGPGDCIDDAPETCESDLRFFVLDRGQWLSLGVAPLPKRFDKSLVYELPRIGRTISVKTLQGSLVERFEFDGVKFNVK